MKFRANSNKGLRSAGYVIFAIMAVAGSARADVITEVATGGFVQDGDGFFSFADFDGRLGTLTGVSIKLRYSSGDLYDLQSATAGPVVALFNSFVQLSFPGGEYSPPSQTIAVNLFFAPPLELILGVSVGFFGSATINALNLADFYATPNFNTDGMELFVRSSLAGGQQELSEAVHIVNAAASIAITYTYDPAPVPEPTALALFSVGILGVFAVSWRGRLRYAARLLNVHFS